jgi:hypothetical protein
MTSRIAAPIAWSLWLLAVAMTAFANLLGLQNGANFSDTNVFLPMVGAFSTVGALVAARMPRNPIGWLVGVFGFLTAASVLERQYAISSLPGEDWVAWLFTWSLELSWGPLILILLLFPYGRLLSPRWRFAFWFAIAVISVGLVTSVLYPVNLAANFPTARSPVTLLPASFAEVIYGAYQVLVLLALILSGMSMILRLVRARGYERQQLKWFAYATVVAVVSFVGVAVSGQEPVIAAVFAFPLIPIAMGIAILKYRLYDIDIIINRTLVYGSLTGTLALVYFGVVTATQALFQRFTGQEKLPQLAIVASTLAIAALFNPLRGRIQSFIDRRFYRRKYDAQKTLEAFSVKLREETDIEALNEDLVEVVRDTMQPAHVSLWLRPETAPKDRQTA